MNDTKKHLADQLAAAVAPMSGEAAPTKAVTKTLRQLAKQLTKQQSKQAKAAQQPTPLTAKRARKALTGELGHGPAALPGRRPGTGGENFKKRDQSGEAAGRAAGEGAPQASQAIGQTSQTRRQAGGQSG